jgi:UDP-glucose 4-epimerase
MRVLITGSAGYLGSKVVSILSQKGGYEIYGIDIKLPENSGDYKHFVRASVTEMNEMHRLFEEAKPDIAVHLAFAVNTLHDPKKEEEIDVNGTQNFLSLCELFNVPKVVFMSSAASYGAYDGAPQAYMETSPLNGNPSYAYSKFKAVTDEMAQKFMKEHPSCAFTMLRPCLFIGPNTNNSFFEVLKFPLLPQIWDGSGIRNVSFQFIHEDDMADCLVSAIEKKVHGIFNVASDGTIAYSDIAKLVGKRRIAVPAWILYPVTSLLWRLRLISSPPGQLDFMRYNWLMDNQKMKRELYLPRFSTAEAFKSFVSARSTK